MNLQIALDRLTEEECMDLIQKTYESTDWIEVGTGVIKEYGMNIIRRIRKENPEKVIVADMKTCDAGKHEAAQAFDAGADITTVMAFAADQTIQDMLHVASDRNKRIMVDLLGITDQERLKQLAAMGVDLVSLHFGKDMQQSGEMSDDLFSLVKDLPSLEVAVAGGINLSSLPTILAHKPDTLIIGSGITKQPDPKETASLLKGEMDKYEANNSDGQ
ncbi:3-hexulose-6-phosphate synthase [Halobacillus alkaliphilus]|uniref:3-hexulose-6-phosphate synthase n=1 Tax=Halobacillus alkaliphilus TaxID=396056 RepID=A0A1I2M1I8_9BACI|nr:3-hexulose-6-phosphate synthase [Halobacillus alkaliphilus]SFF83286.1 3-hexulose-6-phosphate synthase [Halobacillus alkaliphilus]